MLNLGKCHCCNAIIDNDDKFQIEIRYRTDDYPQRVIVLCCYWKCRIAALHYYIYQTSVENKVLIWKHQYLSLEKKYLIPRTNPKIETYATMSYLNNFSIYMKNNESYILMNWEENHIFYEKYIPIKKLITKYSEIQEFFKNVKPLWIYGK